MDPLIFTGFLGILAIYFIFEWIFSSIFLKRLKNNFPKAWKELDSFELIINHSIKGQLLFVKYIRDKMYLDLEDPELTKWGDRINFVHRLNLPTAIIVFVVLLIMVLIEKYFNG